MKNPAPIFFYFHFLNFLITPAIAHQSALTGQGVLCSNLSVVIFFTIEDLGPDRFCSPPDKRLALRWKYTFWVECRLAAGTTRQ